MLFRSVLDQATEAAKQAAVNSFATSFSDYISGFVLFILLFVVCIFVCKTLILIIDAVFKLPILRTFNKGAGLIVGVMQGLVLAAVFCVALSFLAGAYEKSADSPITNEQIQNTKIVKQIYNSSMLSGFIKQ